MEHNGLFNAGVWQLRIASLLIMSSKKLPKSFRIYVRREKARIRRAAFTDEQKKQEIEGLVKKAYPQKHENK